MNMTATTLPFGQMNVTSLFSTSALQNIGRRSSRWQIIEAFLRNAEGTAERLVEGTTGVIILVGIPGRSDSSMFHIYDEKTRNFFLVEFEFQETFNPAQFEAVLHHYKLNEFINIPPVEKPAPKAPSHAAHVPHKAKTPKWGLHKGSTHLVYSVGIVGSGVAQA